MNADIFEHYIETQLVLTLGKGDVVILDHLPARVQNQVHHPSMLGMQCRIVSQLGRYVSTISGELKRNILDKNSVYKSEIADRPQD